jgi:hypothetical protein
MPPVMWLGAVIAFTLLPPAALMAFDWLRSGSSFAAYWNGT